MYTLDPGISAATSLLPSSLMMMASHVVEIKAEACLSDAAERLTEARPEATSPLVLPSSRGDHSSPPTY